jgi:hypothetical protein
MIEVLQGEKTLKPEKQDLLKGLEQHIELEKESKSILFRELGRIRFGGWNGNRDRARHGCSPTGSPWGSPFGGSSALESKLNDYYNTIWERIKKEWTLLGDSPRGRSALETIIVIVKLFPIRASHRTLRFLFIARRFSAFRACL